MYISVVRLQKLIDKLKVLKEARLRCLTSHRYQEYPKPPTSGRTRNAPKLTLSPVSLSMAQRTCSFSKSFSVIYLGCPVGRSQSPFIRPVKLKCVQQHREDVHTGIARTGPMREAHLEAGQVAQIPWDAWNRHSMRRSVEWACPIRDSPLQTQYGAATRVLTVRTSLLPGQRVGH
jgi:hypothetical protein